MYAYFHTLPLDMHVLKRTTSRQLYAVYLFACCVFLPHVTEESDHRSLGWIGDKGVRCCTSCWFCTALWGSSVGRCGVSVRLDYSGMECRCEGKELMSKVIGSPCRISWFLPQGNWLFLMFCLLGLGHHESHSMRPLGLCFNTFFLNQSINERKERERERVFSPS